MIEAVVITLLILLNAAQLLYGNHLTGKIEAYEKVAVKFTEAFNEIMTVVNTNADTQRRALVDIEEQSGKVDYLMMLSDIVFKALNVTKAEYRIHSNLNSEKVENTQIF